MPPKAALTCPLCSAALPGRAEFQAHMDVCFAATEVCAEVFDQTALKPH